MKRFFAAVAVVLVLLSFSGCSLNFFSIESLIVPPEQSGKNGQVQQAFNTLMEGTKFQLKTPVSGEYQTSFVVIDINNDGTEESFVFYSDSSSVESSVRMAFMEYVDNVWSITSDIKGAGSGVYDVNFVDLNGDGILEIFVGWSLLDSKTNHIVSVFEVIPSQTGIFVLNSLGNEYCNEKTFIDFDADGTDDLILVYLDDTGAVQKSYLRMFSLHNKKQLVKYGETILDSSISSVTAIQSDTVTTQNGKLSRLFIECAKNDRMIFTEMVYWNSTLNVPVKVFPEPSISNLRNSLLLCRDIDNDGLLEVPSLTHLSGDEKALSVKEGTDTYTFTLVKWNNAFGDESKDVITTLLNPMDQYLLLFNWGNKVTVKYDLLRESLLFCKWDEVNKKSGEELFSITYRKEVSENEILGEFLAETENGVYYYQITESGYSFGVTDETVTTSFIKIN